MTHRRAASFIALIALSFSSTACEVALLAASLADEGEGEVGEGDGDGGFISSEGNTDIEAASFSGSIGQVTDISTDASATAFDDGEYATITLTASTEAWGAMVAFSVNGADRDALFTPGSVMMLSQDSMAFSYACSGDASDPYAYETTQTSGIITISEASDDMLQVDFEVSYDAGDAVSGHFQIAAP